MVQVCQGTKTKNDMLVQALEQYKAMFIIARREFNKISGVRSSCQTFLLHG
jgi:DNA topoisomerase-3